MIICPSCLARYETLQPILSRKYSTGDVLDFYYCPACDLMFHTRKAQADYYDSQYRIDTNGSEDIVKEVTLPQIARATVLIQYIKPLVQSAGITSALDVGCSTGELPVRLRDELGLDVQGVEPGRAYAEHARRLEVTVHNSIFDDIPPVDLITCIHVLEHQEEPRPFLERLLQLGKFLLVEVPNGMVSRGAFAVHHPLSFTELSLYNLLANTGWSPVWTLAHWGIHPRYVKPSYLLTLATQGKADKSAWMNGSLMMQLSSNNAMWQEGKLVGELTA